MFATFSAGDFASNWGDTGGTPASGTPASGGKNKKAAKAKSKSKSKQLKAKAAKEDDAGAKKVVDEETFNKWGDAVKDLSSVDFASKWGTATAPAGGGPGSSASASTASAVPFPTSDFAGGPPVDDEATLQAESKKKASFETVAAGSSSLTHLNKSRPKGPKGRRPKAAKKSKRKQSTQEASEVEGFANTPVQLHAEGVNIARVGSVKRLNPLFNLGGAASLGGETEADSTAAYNGAVLGLGGFSTTKFVDGAASTSSTTDSAVAAAADGDAAVQPKKKRKMFGWLKGKSSKVSFILYLCCNR